MNDSIKCLYSGGCKEKYFYWVWYDFMLERKFFVTVEQKNKM